MSSLVQSMQENNGWNPNHAVVGCCSLDQSGALIKGTYVVPNIAELPSPYLDGTLDEFLDDGLDVLFQTNRGCPFRCKFCVDGSAETIKIRRIPMERVTAEFNYIRDRSASNYMMVTDLNFGILGQRDLDIAKMISKSNKAGKFPQVFFAYAYKYLNEYNRAISILFKGTLERNISFQSLDDDVIKEVGRYNLKFDEFLDDLDWAKKNDIYLNAELIFGLAGENTKNFIDNIEKLIENGVRRIEMYSLTLIPGSDLAMPEYRGKYNVRTKFRRRGSNYGIYHGNPIIETEEIVVGSDGFDFDDFMAIRIYGLFNNMALKLGYFAELIKLLLQLGLPGEKLLTFLCQNSASHGEHLSSLINDYLKTANAELFDTHEEAVRDGEAFLKEEKGSLTETRIDNIYAGKIILDKSARTELFELIQLFVSNETSDKVVLELVSDYLENILDKQIIEFVKTAPATVNTSSRIDFERLQIQEKLQLVDFYRDQPIEYTLSMPKPAADYIVNNEGSTESDLDSAAIQDILSSLGNYFHSDSPLLRKLA